MSNVDIGNIYGCMGAGGIREISVPPSQVCCKVKAALKKLVFKKGEARVSRACFLALRKFEEVFITPSHLEFRMDKNTFRVGKKNQSDKVQTIHFITD